MAHNSFPSFDNVYQALDQLADKNSDFALVESLGTSDEGRDVKAVYVTDNSLPAAEKEVALVVCGRHGSELGTAGQSPQQLGLLHRRRLPLAARRTGRQVLVDPGGGDRLAFPVDPRRQRLTRDVAVHAVHASIVAHLDGFVPASPRHYQSGTVFGAAGN